MTDKISMEESKKMKVFEEKDSEDFLEEEPKHIDLGARKDLKDFSLEELKEMGADMRKDLGVLQQANNRRRDVMNALHEYNEIKDVTQAVLGCLANIEGVTVKEMHRSFDLDGNDL
ncbi:unnamed protein product [Bemisia tabaci]|uniref:DNA repair protein SWI5 homolog n=1 Tax=Bemisia tabaci TaxID=7038 RepID=A0A9P0A7J9_BEMTA|nr:PREDICTED: DNA repair protein SWI5 homolog [Bemisia tabaci]CAH0385831.1 unnamed protein product [Bemisia tabaci]